MKDLNADFLLDIWQDLKEKRLAPVAVGLVVLLIAMPALMLKGKEEGGDVPLPLPVSAAQGGGKVVLAEDSEGSKLDSYEARDPFKGLETGGGDKAAKGGGSASSPIDSAGKDAGATTGTSGLTGATDSAGTTVGSTGGGDTGGSGTGTGTGAPPTAMPPVKRETSYFNFRLDVKFGKPGREKRYESLSRLSFLQGAGVPVALFLGVTEDQDKALFLVYPGLNHQGEGECIPKPTRCDFLSLEVGREHYFSANDYEFHMELKAIKRVKIEQDKLERKVARKAAARRAARAGDGAVTEDDSSEPYEWPLLVDAGG